MTLIERIIADKAAKIRVNPPHPSGWTVGDRFIRVPFITSQKRKY